MRSLPPWLKTRLPSGENYERIKRLSTQHKLHTVCEEARCPNMAECWGGGTATFMVMGDTCTRGCRFCSVATTLRPGPLNPEEPTQLAETIRDLSLDYIVLTTVCRDDLPDQGASHIAACVRRTLDLNPDLLIEALIGDFRGDSEALMTVLDSGAHVLAHNIETVERLTPLVRDHRATYPQSLEVLRRTKNLRPALKTKSSLMLGLGETSEEIQTVLMDLRRAGVDIVTLGQYLRPTAAHRHFPVTRFISPEEFDRYGRLAREVGFLYVASGPFVRSSYRAGELLMHGLLRGSKKIENSDIIPRPHPLPLAGKGSGKPTTNSKEIFSCL